MDLAVETVQPRRAIRVPPWLLFPIGFGLVRASIYRGQLLWLYVGAMVLLDAATLYALLRLAGRYPLGRRQPLWHLAPFALAAAAFISVSLALQRAVVSRDPGPLPPEDSLLHSVLAELFLFLIWSGLAHTIVFLRRFRAEEAAGLRLRLDLASAGRKRAEAELRSFEAELNPRFLIGALRTAAKETQSDPLRSERLLVEIGDVVRSARSVARETTLGDEIDALAPLVTLEQERLSREVTLTARVPDDLLDTAFPPLVLAALVREVAGSAAGSEPAVIDIVARRWAQDEQRLHVVVSCAQRASAAAKPVADEDVLTRTREHLWAAFGDEARLSVARGDDGMRVELVVPLDRESVPAPSTDSPVPVTGRRWGGVPMVLALWFVALGALNMNTTLTRPRSNGLLAPPHLAIPEALLGAATFTLVLYVAIRMTRRGFGARMLGLHVLAALAMGLTNSMGKWAFVSLVGHPYPPHTFGGIMGRTIAGMMAYAILAGIFGAFEYARRYRSAEEKSLRLRADLAEAEHRRMEAELRALKAELNPHFLGNALAGAASLMHTDPAAARTVLTQLADMLGTAVARVGTQEVTLQEEINDLAPFIAVEQSRFGDRISVDWDVDDAAREARVPHLILQPLIENAVKHGLASRGGRIVVAGRRRGSRLELTVRDNGVGLEEAKRATNVRRSGIGLSNSRARLAQLYGSEATLQLEPAPERGTVVRLTLPWR